MPDIQDLLGKRIISIRAMDIHEMTREGWEADRAEPPMMIVLDDGTKLYPSQDNEGNGPGSLFGMPPGMPPVGPPFALIPRRAPRPTRPYATWACPDHGPQAPNAGWCARSTTADPGGPVCDKPLTRASTLARINDRSTWVTPPAVVTTIPVAGPGFKRDDIVMFGRRNGEQTKAKVVRVNQKTLTLETLEGRGRSRVKGAGRKWRVPPALCRHLTNTEMETV